MKTIKELEQEFDKEFGELVDMDGCIAGGKNDGTPLDYNLIKAFYRQQMREVMESFIDEIDTGEGDTFNKRFKAEQRQRLQTFFEEV